MAVKLRVLGTALFLSVLISQLASLPGAPVVAGAARADTVRVTDDEGASVAFPRPPRRIVSLLPAATEILFEIGAGRDLVGRTRFDSHPPEASEVPSVGDGVRPSV